MKKIYAKVVADLLHPGHIEFFRKARDLGGHLTVSVVPDERVCIYKGKAPILSTEERAKIVASCRYVDAVIGDGPQIITLEYMDTGGYDIYAFGAADQRELEVKMKDCQELPESRRVVIPYMTGISSTEIIQRILSRYGD